MKPKVHFQFYRDYKLEQEYLREDVAIPARKELVNFYNKYYGTVKEVQHVFIADPNDPFIEQYHIFVIVGDKI